jgi:hypothetical protein
MKLLPRLTIAAALAAGAALVGVATPSAAITTPVDINVSLNLSGAPRVFEVTGVVPGPGAELTEANEISNPNSWCGAVEVDIDPDADTISLIAADSDCFFESATVTVTTSELEGVTVVSDTLFQNADPVDASVAGGVLTASFSGPGSITVNAGAGGMTVFSYAPAAEPTVALAPSEVEAGDPVMVTGTGCVNSPVLVTYGPEGGDPIVVEDEVIGDADGNWAYELDTTGLEPGTYDVTSRCVLADGQGFDYDPLSFVVSAEPVAPPAEPAPVAPTFTG